MKSAGSVSQRGLNPLVLFLRVDEIRWFCFSERVESIGSVSQGKLNPLVEIFERRKERGVRLRFKLLSVLRGTWRLNLAIL